MKFGRRLSPDVAVGLACVLFGMLLVLHWTHFGKIIYAQDTYAYVDPWNRLAKQIFVWNTYNSAGGDVHWDFSNWPMVVLFGVSSWIFGSSVAQTLQMGFMFGLGWAAMYAMLRLLRFDRGVALVGTCGYAFNPWTQTLMQDYTINGTLFAIPAIGALLVAGARFPQYRGACRLGLVLIAAFVAAVIAVQPARLVVTIFLFLFFAVAVAYTEAIDRREFTRWLIGSALLSLAAAAWWFPTFFQYFFLKAATATRIPEFVWDVRRASFDNVLRFLPIWSWAVPQYYNYAQAYDANVFCYAAGFLLATFGAVSLVFRDRRRAALVRLAVGFSLAILFLAKGLHEPLSWINALVYRIPGSVMWREPTSKFPPVALATLAVCTAVVLERLTQARFDVRLQRVAMAAVVVLFGASAEALFVGNAWYGNTFSQSSAWVTIPQYWYDAARWLNARPDRSAMATLPQVKAFYQASYTWGMQAWDWLPTDMFHRRNVVLNTVFLLKSDQDDRIHALIADAAERPAPRLEEVLRSLGIRYVLFRGDVVTGQDAVMTLDALRRRVPNAAEKDFGPLAIFDIGPVDYALVTTDASLREEPPLTVARAANRTGFTVPAARFGRDADVGQTLLSVFSAAQITVDELDFSVVNPSKRYVTASIEIAVRPDADTKYVLAANERAYETSVPPSQDLVWARFAHVILKSGLNQFRLGRLAARGATEAARAATGAATGQIRARVERAIGPDGDGIYIAGVGSIPARVPVRLEPSIHVAVSDVFPGMSMGAVLGFTYQTEKYRCFAPLQTETLRIDAVGVVADCLRTAGTVLTVDTIDTAVLDEVTFVALLPGLPRANFVPPIRSAQVSWRKGGVVPAGVAGYPPMPGVEPRAASVRGLLPLAGFVDADRGYLLLRQTYDKAWLALCLGRCSLLPPHARAAGGWNLWSIGGSGTVAIVNLLVVVQLLCYLASLVAIAVAIRGSIHTPSMPQNVR